MQSHTRETLEFFHEELLGRVEARKANELESGLFVTAGHALDLRMKEFIDKL